MIVDIGEEWLRLNDPYYTDSDKNKRKKLDYSYETERMQVTRRRRLGELPFSSLWKCSLYKIAEKGIDVSSYYEQAN